MTTPAKRKGDQGERDTVDMWRAAGFLQAQRGRAGAELDRGDVAGVPDLTTLIVTSMTGNTTFPAPAPVLTVLTAQAKTMRDRIAARDALLQQAQTMTLQIRTDRTILETSLTAESATVGAGVAGHGQAGAGDGGGLLVGGEFGD